ncbi:hypothetical protein LQ757_02455 [Agromyces sp. SYSU K20354]|uniref:hypothetical protein n=1 Tax=Agromyces cavernae TaxID=2898659 RepID=UPI001E65DFDB|nr:hypothetical protein [Agromyces cavernae]MCD2441129.1 hypothetical protein [Agromyces cavernae]
MTVPAATEQPAVANRSRRISRGAILIVGVIVVPVALTVLLNSYGALTVDGALRMAFATVAGQTIAILSAITAVVLTVRRGYRPLPIAAFVLIAAAVTLFAISAMSSAGDLLLTRLDIIAEVDKLNR